MSVRRFFNRSGASASDADSDTEYASAVSTQADYRDVASVSSAADDTPPVARRGVLGPGEPHGSPSSPPQRILVDLRVESMRKLQPPARARSASSLTAPRKDMLALPIRRTNSSASSPFASPAASPRGTFKRVFSSSRLSASGSQRSDPGSPVTPRVINTEPSSAFGTPRSQSASHPRIDEVVVPDEALQVATATAPEVLPILEIGEGAISKDSLLDEANRPLSREKWFAVALRQHPDLLALRERMRPMFIAARREELIHSLPARMLPVLSPTSPGSPGSPAFRRSESPMARLRSTSGTQLPSARGSRRSRSVSVSSIEGNTVRDAAAAAAAPLSFGQLLDASKTEVREVLSRATVYHLILDHLRAAGMDASFRELESTTRTKFAPPFVPSQSARDSHLVRLVLSAGRDVHHIFEVPEEGSGQADAPAAPSLQDPVVELWDQVFGHHWQLGASLSDESNDVDIWDEPQNSPENCVYESVENGQQIQAASVNKLVIHLTGEDATDWKFSKVFLTTYRSFITPEALLYKLMRRYHVPRAADGDDPAAWRERVVKPIQLKVCNVLKHWVETHHQDFSDRMTRILHSFIDTTLRNEGSIRVAKSLSTVLYRRTEGRDLRKRRESVASPHSQPKVPKNIFSASLDLMDCDDEEIARQMTLINYDYYRALEAKELLGSNWTDAKRMGDSPHVMGLLEQSRRVSRMVRAQILGQTKLRARVRVLSRFLSRMEHLRALNDFQSLLSVWRSLAHESISSLIHTRSELSRKHQDLWMEMTRLLADHDGYERYRRLVAQQSSTCIPILEVTLGDLERIENDEADYTPQKLVNFAKRRQVYTVVQEYSKFAANQYGFLPVHQIAVLLKQDSAPIADRAATTISKTLEPDGKSKAELLAQ